MIDFFSKEEGDKIVEAIRLAELKTSGEIRVHLEVGSHNRTFEDAVEVFHRLGMDQTKDRNGILFFVVPEKKEFCIYGDTGINNKVPDGYWAETTEYVQNRFRSGDFAGGICDGILQVGEKLKIKFPYNKDDVNELPNEISYGK